MSDKRIDYNLDVPFKEFMPGQIIQSVQFNDNMEEVEEKVNEVIFKHNLLVTETEGHLDNIENPHSVTAHQVGTYTTDEIDEFVESLKNAEFYDKSVGNRVLEDESVDTRVIKNKSITAIKVDDAFGNQIDISKNMSITDRYTKEEVNNLLTEKVGEGTYSKEELNQMFEDVQAGQIIDGTIDVSKLKDNVGRLLDISANKSIINRYTKEEVDVLVQESGLPRDWGGLEEIVEKQHYGHLPVANVMTADEFIAPSTPVLDIDVREVVGARGGYDNLGKRLNSIDSQLEQRTNETKNISINVKSLGAKGDGITDDTEFIQQAINYVSEHGGGEILLPKGHYIVKGNNDIKLKSNISLRGVNGAIIDFSQRDKYSSEEYKYLISASGSIEESVLLKEDGLKNSYIINCDATNLKEGDLICITSDKTYEEVNSTIFVNAGELSVINYKISDTQIQLNAGLYDNYLLSDNARVYKVNPVENVKVSGITFKGKGRNINTDLDADYGLGFTYCKDITVENCTFKDIDTKQLEFRSCYNFIADNIIYEHEKYSTKDSGGNTIIPCPPKDLGVRGAVQYQVRVADACMHGIISNSNGNCGRHLFNTGHSNKKLDGTSNNSRDFLFGINRFIRVVNCSSRNTWHSGFSTHNDAEYVYFENCTSTGSGFAGFNPRSNYCFVENCTSVNSNIGVYLSDNIKNVIVKNNALIDNEHGIYFNSNNNLDFENIEISQNYVRNCRAGITINSNTNVDQTGRIYIDKNKIINSGRDGSYSGIRTIMSKGRFVLGDNSINECPTTGIYLQNALSVTLINNYVSFCNRALLVSDVNYIYAVNNNSFRCTTNGSWNEVYKATSYNSHNNTFTNSDATNFTRADMIIRTGSTSSRPTQGLVLGLVYFDTSINKLIIYDGAKWVDSTGTSV